MVLHFQRIAVLLNSECLICQKY